MATIWIDDLAVQSFRDLTDAKQEAARLRAFNPSAKPFIMPWL